MEGASMSVLEAMASGLPVICTSAPGLRDLVGDYWPLVPPGNPEMLAERIYEVASALDDVRGRALAVRERIVQRFSVRRFVEAYRGVYQELVGRLNP